MRIAHWRVGLVAVLVTISAMADAQLISNLGGQRSGISALSFLKNDFSPRSIGMAGANASMYGDGYALNANPAAAAEVKHTTIAASNLFYGEQLNHQYVGATLPLGKESGNLSVTLNNLTPGLMDVRTEFAPNGTGEKFMVSYLSAGVGYSRNLSSMFSFGLNAKYIREQLAEYNTNTVAVDLGFLYRTDYKNLRFAAVLQHFGPNTIITGTAKRDPLTRPGIPPTLSETPATSIFKMGVSMDVLNSGPHKLTSALQLAHPNDNNANLRLGAEYNWNDMVFIRGGFKANVDNERLPSLGLGFQTGLLEHQVRLDYGVFQSDFLGTYHSVGLSIALNGLVRTEEPVTPASE